MHKERLLNDYHRDTTMKNYLYISPLTQVLPLWGKSVLCSSNAPAEIISIGGTGNPAQGR